MSSDKSKSKSKKQEVRIEDIYKKKDPVEHILDIPDTWIGSCEADKRTVWVFDDELNRIVQKEITFTPGFYKIFDEIIVNARDHRVRDKTCTEIRVNINRESGEISVKNNGNGIPVRIHSEHGIYVPELLFGNVMTSSTYDRKDKTVGGKNGLGATCCCIFSQYFTVETVDIDVKKKYIQTFSKNMSKKTEPEITDVSSKTEPYTKITFLPDYKRFDMSDGLTNDVVSLLKKRVFDIAACTENEVKVYFNDELLSVSDFEDFIKLHYDPNSDYKLIYDEFTEPDPNNKKKRVCRWKVGVVFSQDGGNKAVSFVNGIWTIKNGTHVSYITEQIVSKLTTYINSKRKDLTIKPAHIREYMDIFITSIIDDPGFSSQSKEELITKRTNFGTTCIIDNLFIDRLIKSGLADMVMKYAESKEKLSLSKTDGKKNSTVRGIDKLEDAHWAGKGKKARETRLILTEGDSAASFALEGLSVIGKDKYGVYPLKGKPLNVRNSTIQQLAKNSEFADLKRILGLQQNINYSEEKDLNKLRYGGIIILTDQDSVAHDTPILIKSKQNNKCYIFEIEDLVEEDNIITDTYLDNKERYNCDDDILIWTEQGWTEINQIIRHKVNKRMFRIITDNGIVDVTEDHSLLDKDGNKIKPSECDIGTVLLHEAPKFNLNYEYDFRFEPYYDGFLCDLTKLQNIINKDINERVCFLKGFYTKNKTNVYKTNNKLFMQYLYYLNISVGNHVSLDYDESIDKYIITKHSDYLHYNQYDKQNSIKKIIDLGIISENYVYDLETNNHHFQAGIGQMIVHNTDGSHIKGLVINMIQHIWPELLLVDGFIQTMATPLIKAFKKTDSKRKEPIIFYSMADFEKWVHEQNNDISKWNIKYYKGLGTSDDKEARDAFKDFENRIVSFKWELPLKEKENKEESDDKELDNIKDSISYKSIDLAFNKFRADDRKYWLSNYDQTKILDFKQQEIPYSEFVNKDLIHFSNYDCIRSIPNIVDGLKPSQRKILHACFKKNLTNRNNELKVMQLSAYVAEKTAYKHGEMSLQEAIVGMAQKFTGSNNINLLYPSGNFGYRNMGGKEHAQSRYIFTYLESITSKIFRKEDESILNYIEDEGDIVEPDYFLPIIPMILVNGSKGVGTGYSTTIPQYNPIDICDNLLRMLDGKEQYDMIPWFNGYNGTIIRLGENSFMAKGKYEILEDNRIKITEIPIVGQYCWTSKYKEYLNTLIIDDKKDKKKDKENKVEQKLVDIISNCGNNNIDIIVEFDEKELKKYLKNGDEGIKELEKYLKLSSKFTVSNLHLYNSKNIIAQYDSPYDILDDFYDFRLKMYEVRRTHYLKVLEHELKRLQYKMKFIKDYLDEKIIIARKEEVEVIARLVELKYPKLGSKYDSLEHEKSYNYLIDMKLMSLTQNKINDLEKEIKKSQEEYEDYKSTTAISLWKREIKEFIEHYNKWLKDWIEYMESDNTKKKSKSKKSKK